MKAFFSILFLFFSLSFVRAQPPSVPAEKGTIFGAKTTADNAINVDQLPAVMQSNKGEKTAVKIKGVVTAVCEEMGCWIKIKSPTGDMMVKMKGHSFFVPLALNGKEVVIDGMAEEKETSVEQLKHYAEDANKTKEEIAAIKEPKKEIIVEAKGVLVL